MKGADGGVHRVQIRDAHVGEEFRLELIGEDEIRVFEERLVDRHRVFVDVDASVVAHDGVEDPEETARGVFAGGRGAQVAGDFAYFAHQGGGRAVAGEEHVEIVKMRVLQAGVERGHFFGGRFAAGEALVGDVVTCGKEVLGEMVIVLSGLRLHF